MHPTLSGLVATTLFTSSAHAMPLLEWFPSLTRRATLPPTFSVTIIGNSTSQFGSNIYRDGGGGGKINGLNWVVFADGTETSGGYIKDDGSNSVGFQSNSIVWSGANGGGPQNFMDFGSNNIPKLFVPFTSDEDPNKTGIWPNSNIVTLCNGACGVGFYPVIDRTTCPACGNLYNTGVNITVGGFGPVATRPVKALFNNNEVNYGTFSALLGIDGYLYMFGNIDGTQNSNGLKMARVPGTQWVTRSSYQYWNGAAWTSTVTPYDDGGKANIFNYSTTTLDGAKHGPDSGDLFYSSYYKVWMLVFQAVGIDPAVYMSYSSSLSGGWSTPVKLFTTPTLNGYNYNIHAYPDYDSTGRVIPISWTQYTTYTNPSGGAFYNAWANVTFS